VTLVECCVHALGTGRLRVLLASLIDFITHRSHLAPRFQLAPNCSSVVSYLTPCVQILAYTKPKPMSLCRYGGWMCCPPTNLLPSPPNPCPHSCKSCSPPPPSSMRCLRWSVSTARSSRKRCVAARIRRAEVGRVRMQQHYTERRSTAVKGGRRPVGGCVPCRQLRIPLPDPPNPPAHPTAFPPPTSSQSSQRSLPPYLPYRLLPNPAWHALPPHPPPTPGQQRGGDQAARGAGAAGHQRHECPGAAGGQRGVRHAGGAAGGGVWAWLMARALAAAFHLAALQRNESWDAILASCF